MAKKRILMVDDEESFGEIVKLNLEYTGEYEVWTERRGSQAVKAALEFKPDLIILDVLMPDMDGPAVFKELRRQKTLKTVPVIYLTALVAKSEQGLTPNEPFVAAKPIGCDELLEIIRKQLGQKGPV